VSIGARSVPGSGRSLGRALPLPLLAAATTVVLWASAFVAIRHVGRSFSPGALSLGRLLVGSLALAALSGRGPRRSMLSGVPRSLWPRLLVCGIGWFGVYNVALNAAERRLDAGTSALLVNVGPILIALAAGFLLGEGFPRTLLSGVVVAFVGVAVIAPATATEGGSSAGSRGLGVVLCLVAAVAYAVGVISQKPLLADLPALQVTWLACTTGAVCCLPWAGSLVHEFGDASVGSLFWVVYLGVFPTAIAFTTWAYALARTSAGKAGATTYLVPPMTVLLSWLLLGEVPPALAFVGGALCLCGVALTRRSPRPAR
jgi:drug/metabolite transporter (DMT)-like permease